MEASICPFSGRACRGPVCPLLVIWCPDATMEGEPEYYCGLNPAAPSGALAMTITPPNKKGRPGCC